MTTLESHPELDALGFKNLNAIYWQLQSTTLIEKAIQNGEGKLSEHGAFTVTTGDHTGRSPNDRFVVRTPDIDDEIWWGEVNVPIAPEKFDGLLEKVLAYYEGKDAYVQNCWGGADPAYRIGVRVINETAWHNVFARNMFVDATEEELKDFTPEFTIIHAPHFEADPEVDGTNSGAFVLVNFEKKMVLIGGTRYAGEIKKSIFSVLNYRLPKVGVLSMHCSANQGMDGDVALFFGLSGTGKTTLSSDQSRILIGDDEHAWGDDRVFNFEGGCYAKVIRLSPEGEPEIFGTTRMFGTILENVVMNEDSRTIDFDDGTLTQNTRASYPIHFIPNASDTGIGNGHPENVIFLTADAFGVMPPVSKLTSEQAMYHFLSGYTAKVAGTERGLGNKPIATFSACFGDPFLPLHPREYAKLLGEKVEKHGANVWLVNTGWTGGPPGVGERMKLGYTRAMVNAILDGSLAKAETRQEDYFGLHIPLSCPNVPDNVLDPSLNWDDKDAYTASAKELAGLFKQNFESKYADEVDESVKNAGPPA